MTIQIELWQVAGLLATLVASGAGLLVAAGQILLRQVEARLDERFSALEKSRVEASTHWDARFESLDNSMEIEIRNLKEVEHDLGRLRAEIPERYARRDEMNRSHELLGAKLDAINQKIDGLIMQRCLPMRRPE